MTLQLLDVVKRYRVGSETVRAVEHVDLQVDAGEMVVVLGPSGSGKTTLLQLAGGLVVPDSGRVRFDGTDLATLRGNDRAQWRREQLGVVFQHAWMPAGTPAHELAALKLLGGETRLSSARRTATRLLADLGLEERLQQPTERLSGGERQRVALARALSTDPRLLLADEPTGSLDSDRSRQVLELLQRAAHRDGRAVLLVTHDERAVALADRAFTLRDGRLDPRAAAPADEPAPATEPARQG